MLLLRWRWRCRCRCIPLTLQMYSLFATEATTNTTMMLFYAALCENVACDRKDNARSMPGTTHVHATTTTSASTTTTTIATTAARTTMKRRTTACKTIFFPMHKWLCYLFLHTSLICQRVSV